MIQLFSIVKTWYSSGTYGCTWEYFSLLVIECGKWREPISYGYKFEWMYWVESRISEIMKSKWFTQIYQNANYGKISKKDIMKTTLSEYQIIEKLKSDFSF